MGKKQYVDPKAFAKAKKELSLFDAKREAQIRGCRDVIRVSKKIIYAVHRNDMKTAKTNITAIQKLLKKVGKVSFDTGMLTVAWQEYVEALSYYYWVKDHKLVSQKQLGCTTTEYLLGLCDLSGELVRRAVTSVSKGNVDEAQKIKTFLEQLHWQFLQFELRNGELRKKSDSLKYHLLKVEDVLCDYTIRRK